MNDLITIGIPTYNTPVKYFDIVLHQLINQTYKNLDILIVDDGSCDDFVLHLRDAERTDSRIRVIFQETNQGIYKTRNAILKKYQRFFIYIC